MKINMLKVVKHTDAVFIDRSKEYISTAGYWLQCLSTEVKNTSQLQAIGCSVYQQK